MPNACSQVSIAKYLGDVYTYEGALHLDECLNLYVHVDLIMLSELLLISSTWLLHHHPKV